MLLCSAYCFWLRVCAAPSGKHPLSSWERISLDSDAASHWGIEDVGLVCGGKPPQTPSNADAGCSEGQIGTRPSQGHLFNSHFLRHRPRLSGSPWHRERWPGALMWGRLSSAHRTETDPSPRSPPVPQCALDWKKQDLQKQLYFQAVNGLDVLVPRGARRKAQLVQLTHIWRKLSLKWKMSVSFNQFISAA